MEHAGQNLHFVLPFQIARIVGTLYVWGTVDNVALSLDGNSNVKYV